jgi:hypothetical protein
MHILINKDDMKLLAKHESPTALLNFAWLEAPHVSVSALLCDDPFGLESLTDLELRLLYKNTTGHIQTGFSGVSRTALLSVNHELITRMPILDADEAELALQAEPIIEPLVIYKYIKGSNKAQRQSDLYEPLTVKIARDEVNEQAAITAAPFIRKQIDELITPTAKQAHKSTQSVPRTPRTDNASSGEAPKSGSKTGRVWEIADAIVATGANVSDLKALRKSIITACEAEGINTSTASVQYGKWKASKL